MRQINDRWGDADRAVFVAGDVTVAEDRQRALALTMERWGRVDVLVNNAGYAVPGAIEELDLEAVRAEFEVNTFAYLAWMQLVGPVMRKQGAGRIINIGSISGLVAFPGLGAYAASKFAIEAISDAARIEYMPWGVRVILVEPGPMATDIWERAHDLARSLRGDWTASPFRRLYEIHDKHARELMDGQGPSPAVVARAVCKAATATRPRPRYCLPLETRVVRLLAYLPTAWRDRAIRAFMGLRDERAQLGQ